MIGSAILGLLAALYDWRTQRQRHVRAKGATSCQRS